jgi:hypothetical protein
MFSETSETAVHRDAETPFDFAPLGADREAALRSVHGFAPLRTALTVRPVRSWLTVEHVC